MEIPESFFLIEYLPLFVLSTFTACILIFITVAMIFALFGFYKSNIASYCNKIIAMGQQIEDMQQHLAYANREETKARADAKRSAEARDKLLTSLSHEIRTPMNGILGMAILLEETTLNPEQKDYIDTIISSGKILLNKVDEVMAIDMLDQSKIDRSITSAQQKNTDLRNCVEEVMETFAVKAAEKEVELLYQIDEDVPPQVLTDNKRLHQILTNLVEHVMDDKQQQIFIGLYIIKHDSLNAPALGFTVGNKPMGNAAEVATLLAAGNILQDSTPEEEQAGKGLGLAISKKLVEEMSGEIRAVDKPNTGFIFSIPLNAVALLAGNTTGYNLKDFEGKQVLIVNNNVTAAVILKNQLQQWKLLPVIATNGNQAMQLIAEQSFSLVITEMNLPEMNGIQLAVNMKEAFPQLPLMLLNPLNDNRYKEQENIAREITVLNKPVKQHTLFDNILSNLRHIKKAGETQEMSVKKLSAEFAKQHPMRIMIAEDNPVNQKWAIKILGKLGYQADIANNGHEALDMVGKAAYDLILMDVQMPEMDGLEATKMIRVCLSKQPTIIAMTANVMHGDRMACMQAGMDDYISKPVQLGELVNMLEKWALVISDKKLA
jgi:CheY-like chemotaxis protein